MSEDLLKTLQAFFPTDKYNTRSLASGLENGDIIDNPSLLANYLQSGLHDESLLEIELGDMTRLFFCRVLDHPPELREEIVDGETVLVEEHYTKGEYLSRLDHIILTPLEPAIGNLLICSTPRVLLRILTSMAAIEFCCYFQEKTRVREMPVLCCSFPKVARQVKGAREYRAKIPEIMEMSVRVTRCAGNTVFTTPPMDICVSGMSLYDPYGKQSDLKPDEKVLIELLAKEEPVISLDGVVRHVTRLRDSKGLQYVFGVQFDLVSRAIAADVEKLVAGVQRIRLRELSKLSDEFGVDFGNW